MVASGPVAAVTNTTKRRTIMSDGIHSPFNACCYRDKCKLVEQQRNDLLVALELVHGQMQGGAWMGSQADKVVFDAIAKVKGGEL